jgi:hypothetical protein
MPSAACSVLERVDFVGERLGVGEESFGLLVHVVGSSYCTSTS